MRSTELRKRDLLRIKRKRRVRGKIFGTSERPRVTIYKSNRFLYTQAIDDTKGHTLASVSGNKEKIASNKEGAKVLGKLMAERLKEKGIEKIVFDRNGYKYHGVVATFAETLRENGIKF